jgi:hypothetical protein
VVAVTLVGAFGVVEGTMALDAADAAEFPLALVAVTLKV